MMQPTVVQVNPPTGATHKVKGPQKPSHDGEPYTEPLRQNPEGRFVLPTGPQIKLTTKKPKKKGIRTPVRGLGTIVTSLRKVS